MRRRGVSNPRRGPDTCVLSKTSSSRLACVGSGPRTQGGRQAQLTRCIAKTASQNVLLSPQLERIVRGVWRACLEHVGLGLVSSVTARHTTKRLKWPGTP
ncbi:hypothetical protein E2C01_015279 [Portunus trituberculatus]|uniref:Uncharacterized protein n=1 Tax=Portunus trituberculatus TaxID=210409 RepID=A0A5B7DLD4_PORTR|nr:hypothetical protein [Portunus trituberculatus]